MFNIFNRTKKYEILKNQMLAVDDHILCRIKALKSFGNVKRGDIGGFIESEHNLSHKGNCWIYDNARVFGGATILGNAKLFQNAMVYDNACIYDNAIVLNYAKVYGSSCVTENARVEDHAQVYDLAKICGHVCINHHAKVYECAHVTCNASMWDAAQAFGNARIGDRVDIRGNATISGNADLIGNITISNSINITKSTDILQIGPIGSRDGYTVFIYQPDNIYVRCGCFHGTIDEFVRSVKNQYDTSSIHRYNYLELVEYVKSYFARVSAVKNEDADPDISNEM